MDSEMGLADVTEDTACELHVEGRLDEESWKNIPACAEAWHILGLGNSLME